MTDVDIYQQARIRARRTPTFRLRRQRQTLAASVRDRIPTSAELASLLAVRFELQARSTGLRRCQPFAERRLLRSQR